MGIKAERLYYWPSPGAALALGGILLILFRSTLRSVFHSSIAFIVVVLEV
jgi:hypothetical protein